MPLHLADTDKSKRARMYSTTVALYCGLWRLGGLYDRLLALCGAIRVDRPFVDLGTFRDIHERVYVCSALSVI